MPEETLESLKKRTLCKKTIFGVCGRRWPANINFICFILFIGSYDFEKSMSAHGVPMFMVLHSPL